MPAVSLAPDLAGLTDPLRGGGLPAQSLPELVQSDSIVILHFVRHLGCMYCKQSVDSLRQFVESQPHFPPIYFVHPSPLELGDRFFAENFPGAGHISDPELKLYDLFGIRRLSPLRLLNPKGILQGFRNMLRGYRNSDFGRSGNIWVLSGTFLFLNGKLVWQHRAQFAGDDPQWSRLSALAPAKPSKAERQADAAPAPDMVGA